MSKYIGPKVKIVRRLGALLGLTRKAQKLRKKGPGQHGKLLSSANTRSSLSSDYSSRLVEKQKLKYFYGVSDKLLFNYYNLAKKKKASIGPFILKRLESRLDCIAYRLGFAPTVRAARQLINHNHFFLNFRGVLSPGTICKKGDIISPRNEHSAIIIGEYLKINEKTKFTLSSKLRNKKPVIVARKNFFGAAHEIPKHLSFIKSSLSGIVLGPVKRKDITFAINELKVAEYYSK